MNYRPEPIGIATSHELSSQDRDLLTATPQMRDFLDLLYRRRGFSNLPKDERDSIEGYAEEFRAWMQGLEELGARIQPEAVDQITDNLQAQMTRGCEPYCLTGRS